MIVWGINALNHGSSLSVFVNDRLTTHQQCVDDRLDSDVIQQALAHGQPDTVFWYEQPWIKKVRQIKAGQWSRVFDFTDMPRAFLKQIGVGHVPVQYTAHHASHAAAGYYTSPFNHCAVVVLDAIGEFECATIWEGKYGELRKVWSRSYPHSLGLFYSAFTDLLGMTAVQDEYILQQMSEQGNADRYYNDVKQYMTGLMTAPKNMHKGICDWPHVIADATDRNDVAAAVQKVFTDQVRLIMQKAKELTNADCLVYMGGCAMNNKAYAEVVEPVFEYRWSLPNPGDPSSSVGAVLYHTKHREWNYNFGVAKHMTISV